MRIKRCLLFLFLAIAVCIQPAVCAIQHDGILKYDTAGDSGKAAGTYGMSPWGHAVLFRNTDPITITGLQVYGCKFGTGSKKVFIGIWDRNLNQLYRDPVPLNDIAVGQMDVNTNNCGAVASWADIPLSNHAVTGDFYVVVFTYSPKADATNQGMNIGFTQPGSTKTSHTVKEGPNKIDDITIMQKYDPSDIDWMIRAYYTKGAAVTTTVTTQAQLTTRAATTTAPAAGPTASGTATETVKPAGTKAGIGAGLVVLGAMIGMILWKRQ